MLKQKLIEKQEITLEHLQHAANSTERLSSRIKLFIEEYKKGNDDLKSTITYVALDDLKTTISLWTSFLNKDMNSMKLIKELINEEETNCRISEETH